MEPQPPQQSRPAHPHLHTILPPPPSQVPSRTANSTPVSSPGLFSPAHPRSNMTLPSQPLSEGTTPVGAANSPYLHPLQSHKVRETHKALVDTDFTTGRKLINNYEIIDELGRGVHGKVKLARNLETGEHVAIKIIPRFSKKRRLGKVTAMSTKDKSKREIAILKKIRHPNVVGLLEIIDDPELKKIYMVLEHVELGEIVWRKKGLPHICAYERRRVEREMRGDEPTPEEEKYDHMLERRQALKDMKRAKMMQGRSESADYWSLEYGTDEDSSDVRRTLRRDPSGDFSRTALNPDSATASKATSRAPSRTRSVKSTSRSGTPHPSELDVPPLPDSDDLDAPTPLRSNPASFTALEGSMYGPYMEDAAFRGRSPSMADSIISHMSSVDYNRFQDPFVDDFSYVPCFSFEQARTTFRDTVLGLEYLHYQGVVHRDIKPANLLWTKDHRVKISDFGVSYFGRPIRDGEPDETISESEARDFDNDLELAKTVGTPAFFAPELCYTESLDDRPGHPQPKVSEQIDVWSLGVTLYCLIFARIPFLAEDEWQMFRKIATEDVYIPRKRLRPVDPATKPDERSLYTRINSAPYRDDDELSYEDIDEDLRDLLSKMLTKNPDKRIRLRDVKRHRWVIKDVPDVMPWLDETDPSRRTSGKKIQVDEREMARAVVPITFLERARSAVKKAVGKVIHPRGERGESSSRHRAGSSAASSAGDSQANGAITPQPRDLRRKSLRGDDYFPSSRDFSQTHSEHPLSQSLTASPRDSPSSEAAPPSTVSQQSAASTQSTRPISEMILDVSARQQPTDRQMPPLGPKPNYRHVHARSVTNAFLSLTPSLHQSQTVPPSPFFDGPPDGQLSSLRTIRDTRPAPDDGSRARSVDRGLFASSDKRAEPTLGLNVAVAPGNVHYSHRPRQMRSTDLMKGLEFGSSISPRAAAHQPLTGYQHGQPQSDPNIHSRKHAPPELEERPMTAHRVGEYMEARALQGGSFTAEPLNMSSEDVLVDAAQVDPAMIPCPPSPDNGESAPHPPPPAREETMSTMLSSSMTSMAALATPLTSPSVSASPISSTNQISMRDSTDQMLAFRSDPSLPALLSGASSVSADLEGELLGNPGVVNRSSVIDTTDSLTPPALAKEPMAGFPLEETILNQEGVVPVQLDDRTVEPPHIVPPSTSESRDCDEADDSDSDEGLTMMKSKKSRAHAKETASLSKLVGSSRRRDTNISVGSTDTAKKIVVDSD